MRHGGVELRGDESPVELAAKAGAAGVDIGAAREWDDIFFQIWLDRVEPVLGVAEPLFVLDWPAPLGALARRRSDDPRFVERFELYVRGLELANAFGELTDPHEQRARFESESMARRARGKVTYPVDEKLLAALGTMPPTAGVALGFDRLMMVALGAKSMDQVMAFPSTEV
jgi:lysyl-tRNA synthetase class 2